MFFLSGVLLCLYSRFNVTQIYASDDKRVDGAAAPQTAWRGKVLLGAGFIALWGILCRHLSSEWTINEQYAYGWFVPLFSLYLFCVRWQERPAPQPPAAQCGNHYVVAAWLLGAFALATLLPLRLIEVANPDWRPLGWLHAAIAITVTLLALWTHGGNPWLRHFAFPVGFFLVAVPWVSPIENPVVQGLQRLVATVDVELMAVFCIPAGLDGSVIRLRTGVVGVNEACSGIRSLQTSLMVGLLFGEVYQFRWPRRLTLILGALALAFGANVLRGAVLVWAAATHGIAATERLHDWAGFGVLVIVFAGTMGLTAMLRRRARADSASSSQPDQSLPESVMPVGVRTCNISLPPVSAIPLRGLALMLCWLLAVEVGVESWYRWHERNLVPQSHWTVRWPKEAPGFREVRIEEGTRRTLRYDVGGAAAWREEDKSKLQTVASVGTSPLQGNWQLYFFRWEPGHGSILRARSHRPDLCLPNTGWRQTADWGTRFYPASGTVLPFRHFTFIYDGSASGGNQRFAHAFFCVQGDKIPARENDRAIAEPEVTGETTDWMAPDRLRVAWEGRRDPGQQVLEVVLTTAQEIGAKEAEDAFRDLVPKLLTTTRLLTVGTTK